MEAGSLDVEVAELLARHLDGSAAAAAAHGPRQPPRTSATGPPRSAAASAAAPGASSNLAADLEGLRTRFQVAEGAVAASVCSLVLQCGTHVVQADFLLSTAIPALQHAGLLSWDALVPKLLQKVVDEEAATAGAATQGSATSVASNEDGLAVATKTPASMAVSQAVGEPRQTPPPMAPAVPAWQARPWLRPLVCQLLLQAVAAGNLKPLTALAILTTAVEWLAPQCKPLELSEVEAGRNYTADSARRWSVRWLEPCVRLIEELIDPGHTLVPAYTLLHDRTQLPLEEEPEDENILLLLAEMHHRRDRLVHFGTMSDGYLHGPTFATLRVGIFTYLGCMGQPLHGEGIAEGVPRGSLEWERALRCLHHGLRCNPTADWWRKVLVIAPRYQTDATKLQHQQATPKAAGASFLALTMPEFSHVMTCEAIVDRIMELLCLPASPGGRPASSMQRWQEWLAFADLFYYVMRAGFVDFLDFLELLSERFAAIQNPSLKTNHVTWLLAQIFRLDTITQALQNDPHKMEVAKKVLSFHVSGERDGGGAVSLLLDFVGSTQILRLWSMNHAMMEQLEGNRMQEHIEKGKALDEWWQPVQKRERILDYADVDDKTMGMVWVLSHTMSQTVCEAITTWMNSQGFTEMEMLDGDLVKVYNGSRPLPISFLSGLSLHTCARLMHSIDELLFKDQVAPSIAMMETYSRLLLLAPQTLFRNNLVGTLHKYQPGQSKTHVPLKLLELLTYRLLPFFRYHGRVRGLVMDLAKVLIQVKARPREHRLYRLAESLATYLVLFLREVMLVKRELKGAQTDFSETLNRLLVRNLAHMVKTRGILEFEQMMVLQPALEQFLANSTHTWSAHTLRHMPPLEEAVLYHCRQLFMESQLDTDVGPYLSQMDRKLRCYLLPGAWILMDGQPQALNLNNLAQVLTEFTPEEVTTSIYNFVDVLLHTFQIQMSQGQDQMSLLLTASSAIAEMLWLNELLPMDVVLQALTDRDDDPLALRLVVGLLLDRPEFRSRVQRFCDARRNEAGAEGEREPWLHRGPFTRSDPLAALGSHMAGQDLFPVYFDDMCLRAVPTVHLIVHRLIEHDATVTAEKLLSTYQPLLLFHPHPFAFVRDTLAYFYGSIPQKFAARLLNLLDFSKVPFSSPFLQLMQTAGLQGTAPLHYFSSLLSSLAIHVVPPVHNRMSPAPAYLSGGFGLPPSVPLEGSRGFCHYQGWSTHTQLLLETAVLEILALPPVPDAIIERLVEAAVTVPPPVAYQGRFVAVDTAGGQAALTAPTLLKIQACGLLLAQLPEPFHMPFYRLVAGQIVSSPWVTQANALLADMEPIIGRFVGDASWSAANEVMNPLGKHRNMLALAHALCANLPFEWLEGSHEMVKLQRPVRTVAQLKICFKLLGPLLPRMAISRPLFAKTIALLFTIVADIFGRSVETPCPNPATDITDLVDFLHHAVMLEGGQGGRPGRRPRVETLALCAKAVERLRPDLQALFRHLTNDQAVSIYAATHPKLAGAKQAAASPSVIRGVLHNFPVFKDNLTKFGARETLVEFMQVQESSESFLQ
eukprot:SM000044S16014  [mRNA]  locus=s44:548456:560883:- [translate_table: standard]